LQISILIIKKLILKNSLAHGMEKQPDIYIYIYIYIYREREREREREGEEEMSAC